MLEGSQKMEWVMTQQEILEKFRLFIGDTGGFDGWITETAPEALFERLSEMESNPLSLA